MTKSCLIAGTLLVLLAGSAQAQKKSESTANNDSLFSSYSNLVVVDSIVTDKKGAYIGDLMRKDFKVRDEGKEQAIVSFSPPDGAPDDRKHALVLLFDNSTVPQIDQHYARDAATKFIGSNAGLNYLLAVVEFDGTLRVTQNLTDDVDKLKQAVNETKFSATSAGTLGAVAILRPANRTAKPLPGALGNVAKGLARLPGRKTVLLFSEGMSTPPDQMKGAIDECNRANVAIYPVDIHALTTKGVGGISIGDVSISRPMGTYPPQNPVPPRQAATDDLSLPQSASDLLYGLARGTGGFVVSSTAKLNDDLNRIGTEESQYYQLGFLPPGELKPGACHTIKVHVDRGGANVRARNGYCDTKIPEVQTGTPTERDLEARLNANAAPTVPATMQTPFFYVAPNTARVDLALDIPGAGVKFAKDKGGFTAALNVVGIAYFPDGGVAARFNDTAKFTLNDQKEVDEFASRPWHFEKQFEMASGAFDLKVAFSSGAASFGKVETPLTIDPWDASKFLLSGLALSQSTRPAAAAGLGDVDLLGDQVPLVFHGVQYIPAGTNRLLKSQKAFIYGEISEPALATPGRKGDPGLSAELILLAASGEAVDYSGLSGLKPETVPGTSAVPLGMVLPVDRLAPGSYTAQLTVQDAAGNRSVRRINFELVP